ncbi:hypothetical protein KIN20_000261 [Parelaphostrongylus tenuis]|uniref:Uncharacterized protein n=1 Tax=Parelaphostrongylus tenuis TaxID=148309 RepID=A0AAD5QBP9_PARTN|nr:hypothetical protein KIN20_000261 [Parelaphostrongylus tenuis]
MNIAESNQLAACNVILPFSRSLTRDITVEWKKEALGDCRAPRAIQHVDTT